MIKLIRSFTLLALAIVLPFSSSALAANSSSALTTNQQSIVRFTLAVDGKLTPEMHQQFWDEVPEALKDDPQELTIFRLVVLKMQSESFLWQKEVWTSIGLSLAAGRRTVSPNYEAAKESFLKFAESIDAPSEAIEEGLNHAEGMLVAAANKREFLGPEGSIALSRELVEQVLSGIEGSQDRLRVLLNPNWGD